MIKKLGVWIGNQQKNYANKTQIMINEELYNKWTTFIKEYKEHFIINEEKWENSLNKVRKYIYENKKKPSTIDKNQYIKILGAWIDITI